MTLVVSLASKKRGRARSFKGPRKPRVFILLFFKHFEGPRCALPHPDAGTPAPTQRDAERQRETRAGSGAHGLRRGGPWEENRGAQSPTPASSGLGALGCPHRCGGGGDQFFTFPICARGVLPEPSDPRFLGVQSRSPGRHLRPRGWEHPGFPLGERSVARGTEISPVCSAGAASAKTRNQLCLRCRAGRCPDSWGAGECGSPRQACGRARHRRPAVRPGLLRAPRLPDLAVCAPSGRLARTACSFQTRATSTISLPCRSFLISSVEINIKVKGPAGKLSQTEQDISATVPHLF